MEYVICAKCKEKTYEEGSISIKFIEKLTTGNEEFRFYLCPTCGKDAKEVLKKFVGWADADD